MQNIITRNSRVRTIAIITLVSILASIFITVVIMEIFANGVDPIALSISIIAPAIIAPSVTWHLVGLTIKVHHLEEEQRALATYDMLTGLHSRRAFLDNFDALLRLVKRNHSLLSLAYIDIDNFKKINDTYGHAGGDAVLKSFGTNLLESIRKSDLAGRIGGEEFAVVLPDTNLESAVEVLTKILHSTKNRSVDIDNQTIHYTISIGVTVWDNKNQASLAQLMKQSDTALYQAKNSGKDCIVEYSASQP